MSTTALSSFRAYKASLVPQQVLGHALQPEAERVVPKGELQSREKLSASRGRRLACSSWPRYGTVRYGGKSTRCRYGQHCPVRTAGTGSAGTVSGSHGTSTGTGAGPHGTGTVAGLRGPRGRSRKKRRAAAVGGAGRRGGDDDGSPEGVSGGDPPRGATEGGHRGGPLKGATIRGPNGGPPRGATEGGTKGGH